MAVAVAALDGVSDVANLKRERAAAVDAGALERQLQIGAAAWAGKGDPHRVYRQFQFAFAALADGLDVFGLGHPRQACGAWQAKGNPALRGSVVPFGIFGQGQSGGDEGVDSRAGIGPADGQTGDDEAILGQPKAFADGIGIAGHAGLGTAAQSMGD